MFITTLRVRRARRDSLSKFLSAAEQRDVETREVLEVMAHAAIVALVDVTDVGGETLLWMAPAAAQVTTEARMQRFAVAAAQIMPVGERVALEAQSTGTGLRGRAAATRRAARA